MAEAGAATLLHRFFCHCCKRETQPKLPDFVCPRCKSDFIEEVAHDSRLLDHSPPETSEDSNSLFSELWQLLFMERSALLSHPPSSELDPEDGERLLHGQSCLPLVSPGNAEVRELQLLSQSEEERPPRPEQRPEVEGCKSDFIEEVAHDSRLLDHSPPETSEDSNSLFSELWQLLFMERSALLSHPPSSELDPEDGERLLHGQSCLPLVSPGNAEVRELQLLSQSEEERPPRPEQRPEVEGIVQQFLADLFMSNGNPAAAPVALSSMLQLYSNPADYAWGQGGLDAVITELFGQLENTGPPPAEKDMISSLPTVCISQEQKECRLECTICREEYSSGESVRKLPCLHYFHSECIVPWLELHDTCPVCRKSLDGIDNSFLPHASQSPEGRFIRTEQQ
uniref:E3 ubiquitin-protein ligase RNF115-like n=1 Tax=Doryrhamphus excisus TaxID=161450 RepID=UPI0025AE0245|nr:E3 ubiquitin-protein ligase RNF115-like [Doryrhamphus excisus]